VTVLERRLFERQLFAIFDHRPLRVGGVCYGEDYTFIYIFLFAALSTPGIIRKLETELIGFGPTAWVIYANGNDDNIIDVAFFTRRDSGLRNARKAHGLCEFRIWITKRRFALPSASTGGDWFTKSRSCEKAKLPPYFVLSTDSILKTAKPSFAPAVIGPAGVS
jgi:hypothetical protein